jgi:hypothetical protein
MQNVKLLDVVGLRPERGPIKALPVTILQLKQNGQDEEHHRTGHDALFVHEEGSLAPRPRNAKRKRHSQGK